MSQLCSRCGRPFEPETPFGDQCPHCLFDFGMEAVEAAGDADERIGPYTILERLGEGGMGVVYLAEQNEPIQRQVALKVIKPGMDSAQVIARFEGERQALALMNHTNVARVFDAGVTPQGRPYFVMEYVEGAPITRFCDERKLSLGDRLDLFVQACEGIQHAHQKGIIHRDVKPSNVLVGMEDGRPLVKVIDFGVAKATTQRLTEQTLFTQHGVLLGTPVYMSPEQAEALAGWISTRAATYTHSECCSTNCSQAGALPFEQQDLRDLGGLRRRCGAIIRDRTEPPKPSSRLSTASLASEPYETLPRPATGCDRRSETERVDWSEPDLDWIVMKALEKEPERRYASPLELAADLGRYRRKEPVLAGPPGAVYRARKFVQRHTLGVTAASVLLLGLVTGVAGSTFGLLRAKRAEARSLQEAARSERVSEFLAEILRSVEPQQAGQTLLSDLREQVTQAGTARGGTETQVARALASFDEAMIDVNLTNTGLRLIDEQMLARAAARIEEEQEKDLVIAGRLYHTIGETYERLGLYDRAEEQLLRAVDVRREALGDEHENTLASRRLLAWVYVRQGRYEEAEPLLVATLESARRRLGIEHPQTHECMQTLGWVYYRQARYDEAEPLFVDVLAASTRLLGNDDPQTLRSMNRLALLRGRQGRHDEAERLHLESLEIKRRMFGDAHPSTLGTMSNLGFLYHQLDRHDEAEPLFLEALSERKRVLGDDHPHTLSSMNNLATVYLAQQRYEQAELLYVETLEIRKLTLGEEHPQTLRGMNNLADTYRTQGRYEESQQLFLATFATRKRVLGDDHPDTLETMYSMSELYRAQGGWKKPRS